ncbi:Molybdopterin converting factor, small subunit [Sanguibacter gelidistatuariae]|uniref:Molybdopterin converting factor, small subunit n=1 Tax=Sanguibacter gelidistatuariae TaxID=1814289 RepID=A0A1G6GQB9_9MICO|nr:MoaD/ThiS family protein [Sanguibacter gelidistatuariae]SDB84177.1 Molybdopterin converting factor, small subunit [Sanguibacter gelidistatuariae]
MATVRYFAGAAEAAGVDSETLEAATVGDLLVRMGETRGAPLARVLTRCSLLVNGVRSGDPAAPLSPADAVDVLPPFAGG